MQDDSSGQWRSKHMMGNSTLKHEGLEMKMVSEEQRGVGKY